MFNWTTTTIINSLKDYSTGLDLIKVWTGAGDADENGLKPGFAGPYPTIKIKRDFTFESRYISSVYKAQANNPSLCEMTIDCTELASQLDGLESDDLKKPMHVRLSFYISLEGSEESIYANDWYQKGKPFSVGFDYTGKDDAKSIAQKIKKNAEKFGVVTYGKKVFELIVGEDETSLTLKGTHEYQRIKMAAISVDDFMEEIIVDFYEDGTLDRNDDDKPVSEGKIFTLENRGINGFGTYHHLVKDLRLPTVHNTKWLRIKADETPVVGAKYDQFIITYCAPSMANPGFTVVGQHNMSVTTHVFWVNQAVSGKFEELLGAVATITPVNKVTAEDAEEVTLEVGGTDTVEYSGDGIDGIKVAEDAGTKYSTNHPQKLVHTEAGEDDKTVKE